MKRLFSTITLFVLAAVFFIPSVAYADEWNGIMNDFIDNVKLYDNKGENLEEYLSEIDMGIEFIEIRYHFSITNDTYDIKENDTYTYAFPDAFNILSEEELNKNIPVKTEQGDTIANVVIDPDNNIVFTFTGFVEDHDDVEGYLSFGCDLDRGVIGDPDPGAKTIITFQHSQNVSQEVTLKFDSQKTPANEKTGTCVNSNTGLIDWTITLNTESIDFSTDGAYTLTDVIPDNSNYVAGSAEVNSVPVYDTSDDGDTFSYNAGNETLTLTGDALSGQVVLTFSTVLENGIIENKNKFEEITVSNSAKLNIEGEDIAIGPVAVTVPRPIIEKRGNYDSNTGKVDWEIRINQDEIADVSGAYIIDEIDDGLTFDTGSLVINGSTSTNYTTTNTPPNPGEDVRIDLGNIVKENPQIIKYSTFVDMTVVSSGDGVENKAHLYDGTDADIANDQDEVTVTYMPIEKTGRYNSSTDLIDWTVTVNPLNNHITRAVIKDTIPNNLSLEGETLLINGSTTPDYTVEGQLLTVNLGEIYTKQVLTYSTAIEYFEFPNSTTSFTNAGEFTGDGLPAYSDNDTVSVDTRVIKKTSLGIDYGDSSIEWEIIINPNDINISTGKILTDTYGAGLTYGGDFSIKIAGDNDSYDEEDDTDYDSANYTLDTTTSSNKFTLKFHQALGEMLILRYKTNINEDEITDSGIDATHTFSNTASFEYDTGKTASDDAQSIYYVTNIIDKSNMTFNYETQMMEYSVIVNKVEDSLSNVIIEDVYDPTLFTHVPESISIKNSSGTLINEGEFFDFDKIEPDHDEGSGNTKLTFNFNDRITGVESGVVDEKYTMTYLFATTEAFRKGQGAGTLTNSSSIAFDGIDGSVTDNATESVNRSMVDKDYIYKTSKDYVDWNIKINPNSATMTDAIITDTLPEGVFIDKESVTIYEATWEDANSSTGITANTEREMDSGEYFVEYDFSSRLLKITLPETIDSPYVLSYRVYVESSNSTISNDVSINWTSEEGSETRTDSMITANISFSAASAGGSGTGRGNINITKRDENNEILGDGADEEETTFWLLNSIKAIVGEATTTNGVATFNSLDYDVDYYIQEKNAPTGYKLSYAQQEFSCSGEEPVTMDFVNQPISYSVGDYVWLDSDEDGIQDDGESGVNGATVRIYNAGDLTTALYTTTTANDSEGDAGYYYFGNLPEGDYLIEFEIDGITYEYTTKSGDVADMDNSDAVVDSVNARLATTSTITLNDSTTNYEYHFPYVDAGIVARNDTAAITLTKTDGTSSITGSSATFRLYLVIGNEDGEGNTETDDILLTFSGSAGSYSFDSSSSTTDMLTNSSTGTLLIDDITYGDYYFVETDAPDDYDINEGHHSITVDQSGEVILIPNDLSTSDITLTKTDGTNAITFDTADFTLYETGSDNPIILSGTDGNYTYSSIGTNEDTPTTMTTDSSGVILVNDLIYGDYYFMETSVPYGYQADLTTQYPIDVDADTEILSVANTPLTTYNVSLTKTDGTSAITNNAAGFRLYTSVSDSVLVTGSSGSYTYNGIGSGSETATEFFTADDGSLNIANLPIGDYYFVETDAPVNYTLNSTKHHDITVDGTNDSISVENTLAPIYSLGDYVWIDENEDGVQDADEIPVDDITVTLFDENDNQIGDPVTTGSGSWESGYYNFSGLTAGSYYVVFSNLPEDYYFTSADSGTDDTSDSDANTTTGVSQTVLVDNTTTTENHYPDLDGGIYLDAPGIFSIGDYVWIDADEDGIQESGEASVDGVTVKLFNSNGTQVGESVVTGAGSWDTGYYEFTELPEGDYYVQFSDLPSGYSFTVQNSGSDDDYDSDANSNTGRTGIITLNEETTDENGHYSDLDAGIFFDPDHANVYIHANKLVNGYVPLECEEFGFTITKTEINGDVITGTESYSETVYNDRGDIDINLEYDKSDVGNTYYYTISEEDSKLFGYTTDSSAIDVEVSVYLDDVVVEATVVEIFEGSELTSDYTFNNEFKELTPEEIEEEGVDPIFTVTKTVDGQTVEQGEIFSFEVQQVDENGDPVAGGLNEVVQNDSTGYAEFSQILYYAKDIGETYYYEVTEVAGSGNYVYDTSKYTATIEITNEDPSTPAVVEVVMRDENGVEQSRTVIEDQGLEVRVPSVSFDNDSIVDSVTEDDTTNDTNEAEADETDEIEEVNDTNDNESEDTDTDDSDTNDLPGTATNSYLWLIIAFITVVAASIGVKGILTFYRR